MTLLIAVILIYHFRLPWYFYLVALLVWVARQAAKIEFVKEGLRVRLRPEFLQQEPPKKND